jgi:hypothetical protein
VIRRAARLAEKGAGGEVLAVYIASSDGPTSASPKKLAVQRSLVEERGATFHHVVGDDIPVALLDFARGVNATQIVLGVSRRKSWQYIFGPGVIAEAEAGRRRRCADPDRPPVSGRLPGHAPAGGGDGDRLADWTEQPADQRGQSSACRSATAQRRGHSAGRQQRLGSPALVHAVPLRLPSPTAASNTVARVRPASRGG